MFVCQYREYSRSRRPHKSNYWNKKVTRKFDGKWPFYRQVGIRRLWKLQYGWSCSLIWVDFFLLLGIRSGGMHLCSQWWSFVFCIPAQKEPLMENPGIASYVVPVIIWHISVDLSHVASYNRSVVNYPMNSPLCCDELTWTQETVSLSTHINLFSVLSSHAIIFSSFQKQRIIIWLWRLLPSWLCKRVMWCNIHWTGLVVGLSPRMPGFISGPGHVGFLLDCVALGDVSCRMRTLYPVSA
jgi:hypothetical protein